MKAFLTFLTILAFTSLSLPAHQDTVLNFIDGRIEGLPKKYDPASFNFEKMTLTIKDRSLVLPEQFKRLFIQEGYSADDPFVADPREQVVAPFKYKFSASWYHHEIASDLPPYLHISITTKTPSISYSLLIDLDKLALIEASLNTDELGSFRLETTDSTP